MCRVNITTGEILNTNWDGNVTKEKRTISHFLLKILRHKGFLQNLSCKNRILNLLVNTEEVFKSDQVTDSLPQYEKLKNGYTSIFLIVVINHSLLLYLAPFLMDILTQ